MKTSKKILFLVLAVVLVLVLVMRVRRTFLQHPESLRDPVPTVRVAFPLPETRVAKVRYLGEVRGAADAELSFRAPGLVVGIEVSEGMVVEAGQVLAAIELPETGPRVAQAQHQLLRAELEWAHLKDAYERDERLYASGAIARSRRDQGQLQQATAEAAMGAARAVLAEAEARYEQQFLRSPVAGVIAAVQIRPGEVVAPGKSAVSLAAGPREIEVDVLESDWLRGMGEGSKAWMITTDGQTVEGHVARLDGVARLPFRTIRVRLAFSAAVLDAYPAGASVPVEIACGQPEEILTVPLAAIDRRAGGARVFRIGSEDILEAVPVTLGDRHDGRILVEGSLKPSDRIVASGVTRLTAGMAVHAMQEGAL